ncbi:Myosin-I heavy chain [Labeo rohita]|uniref:Myosin-I heavy chain n=1 Tax=Labeo rohita TaxID=84645 RepID=A0ABQ8MRE6_LABRO|nr:Myosin-I heavy chain [Labeo rohita]
MDEAIGSRPSITPPALDASSGPDVAVASLSSVMPEPRWRNGKQLRGRKEDEEKWRRRKTDGNERDRRERRDKKEKPEKERTDGDRKQVRERKGETGRQRKGRKDSFASLRFSQKKLV